MRDCIVLSVAHKKSQNQLAEINKHNIGCDMKITKLFSVLLLILFSQSLFAEVNLKKFKKYEGDFDGDGITDAFYQGRLNIIPVELDDLFIPIVKKEPIHAVIVNGVATKTQINIPYDYLGFSWLSNHYKVHVADFDGDKCDDLFLQAKHSNRKNYLLHSKCTGNFTALAQEPWGNGYLGFDWSADKVDLTIGYFDGDQRADFQINWTSNVASSGFSDGPIVTQKNKVYVYSDASGAFDYATVSEVEVWDIEINNSAASNANISYDENALAVGKVNGSFSVSPTGAAGYNVPIVVPAGVGGMQPGLSINYSSQGGNGLLGVGWGLGGISSIQRCPQNYAQDGALRGLELNSNDRLCMDGQRLIAVSGSYGASGTEYRTES
ncbi:MAG: hypothetical protein OEY00_10430, partial [Gammaproteobacteria bacterium]|nr:hypothetical protein [Gammaproteobacteria bacterium]